MSFEKNFCPSPWFHMRINNSGTYEFCRWMKIPSTTRVDFNRNIQSVSPLTYFQKTMSPIRKMMLDGQSPGSCQECHTMEAHGKVSGRQRQLLKAGVLENHFNQSLASSPLRPDFNYSYDTNGDTLRTVSDWQIDLGNYCNGACIICNPESSSRLAAEFKQLGIIDQIPPPSWCDDPVLLEKFIQDLTQSTNLQYLHFLGGETVITPGFKKILTALIVADMAQNLTIGFTTNLTVWSDDIVELLIKFKQVNLGLSVETLTPVNDYVRYPSVLKQTYQLLERWRKLGQEQGWLIQLRITPTCLTVHALDTVYEYAWEHEIAVESCNFLYKPEYLRIGVLPEPQKNQAKVRLAEWIINHPTDITETIINTRNPGTVHAQIRQDALSYLEYFDSAEDESYRLPDLISYLRKLEQNRGNTILTYLPEYEELFRSAGY